MTISRAVSILAGFMVLLSLGLAQFSGQIDLAHPSWLWLTTFVGANLFQSGFTGFCPAASVFKALGLR
jgi:ABC-type arginine/histidine transport system permease subunit